jgi:phenylacetate-CoA ligase
MNKIISTFKASKSGFLYIIKYLMAIRYLKPFKDAVGFSLDQYHGYQREQLENVLRHCIQDVPYYRERKELYVKNGKLVELSQMPVISKQQLRKDAKAFYADSGVGACRFHKTSGTSGTPLTLKASYRTYSMFTAGLLRYRGWYGLRPLHRAVCLTGFFTPATVDSAEIAWRDYVAKRLFLSIYQLNDKKIVEYADLFKKFKPEEIFGYASSLHLLAQAFKRNNIEPVRTVKVVTSTSEVMYPNWRECIQQVFNAPVADQYGSQELQCLITQCPKGTMHINPEFGIVEIVDDDMNSLPPGQEGQMLLTGLANNAMPLIRYQIGDRTAFLDPKIKCQCGLNWPGIRPVEGRSEDAIVTPDGRVLMYLNFHCTKNIGGIVESQFIQDGESHIKILLVVDDTFLPSSEQAIISNILQRSQYKFDIDVEYVDQIPRGARGKFKAVVNLLNKK